MESHQDIKVQPTPVAIVFDTETTGLPPWHRDPMRLSDWDGCRLVQMAWMVLNDDGSEHSEYNAYIKPDGFEIPARATEIHGITNEIAHRDGRYLDEVLHAFQVTLERFPQATLVAHNLEFDLSLLITESKRHEIARLLSLLDAQPKHCTMLKAVEGKKRRWPKLGALYKELFAVEPEGNAHDAMWDVRTCAQIYRHQAQLM